MNLQALSGWFTAHKTEAVLVGGAAVAGLALVQRKKAGSAAAAGSGVTAGAVAPGTIPAGSVLPPNAYADSTSYDLYNALQDEIGTLAQQGEAAQQTGATGTGTSAAVGKPIASTLYGPEYTGNYWSAGKGRGEIESDGSFFLFNPQQWAQAQKQHPGSTTSVDLTGKSWFSTGSNLQGRAVGSVPLKAT